ncbi:MAG: glycosyltransferase family 39 protein [Parvularculaceae bacterium]
MRAAGAWGRAHGAELAYGAGGGVLLAAIFSRIMNYALRRDEHLYVAPASLLRDFDLYTDFFYNHPPVSAWAFRAAAIATGETSFIVSSRLFMFCVWLAIAAAVAFVSWRLTRSRPMTAFLTLSILSNDVFLTVTGMAATNNFLSLPLIYLGVSAFALGVAQPDPRTFFGAGLALGLAASVKVSAAVVGPVVFACALFSPAALDAAQRLRVVAAPVAQGGLLGAAPAQAHVARAPEQTFAHLLSWHIGPHRAYWATQPENSSLEAAMGVMSKATLAYSVWTTGANALLIAAGVLLALMVFASRRAIALDGRIVAVTLSIGALAAAAFSPTPGFPQYYAPPVVLAPLLMALLFARLDADAQARARPAFIALSVALVVVNAPRLTKDLARLPFPERWTTVAVHNSGLEIAARMAAAGADGKVATFAPIYPLEGGLSVYQEMATGPFVVRTTPFMSEKLARQYKTTSPDKLYALLRNDPPGALLLGVDYDLEAPLRAYARDEGYERVEDFAIDDRDGVARLYLRRPKDESAPNS